VAFIGGFEAREEELAIVDPVGVVSSLSVYGPAVEGAREALDAEVW
jgi:hypothetical protein